MLVIPPKPWNFRDFSILAGIPPGKNSFVKKAVALYYYAKCFCFCDKKRKIFLFMLKHGLIVSIFPFRNLS